MHGCLKKFSSIITGLAFSLVCKILWYFGYSVKRVEKYPALPLPKYTSSSSKRLDVSRVVNRHARWNNRRSSRRQSVQSLPYPQDQTVVSRRLAPRSIQGIAEIIEVTRASPGAEVQYWLHVTHPGHLCNNYYRLDHATAALYLTDTGGLVLDRSIFNQLETEDTVAWQEQGDADREELLTQFQNFDPEPDGEPEVLDF